MISTLFVVFLIAASVTLLLWVLFLFYKESTKFKANLHQTLEANTAQLREEWRHFTREMNDRLRDHSTTLRSTNQQLDERLANANQIAGEVRERLGVFEEAYRRVYDLANDISGLHEILQAPKLRGGLGELVLGDLLAQVLPHEHFTLQYAFKNGDTVDALIYLGHGAVPVDAKFPLDNFRKYLSTEEEEIRRTTRKLFVSDVKRHIDQVAKYIHTDEGTFDFALMYIPAENVYYETIITNKEDGDTVSLSTYALERRVIPVSPMSFYAYLSAICLGLRGMRVEASAKEVLQNIQRIKKDFERFADEFRKTGSHLKNAVKSFEQANRKLDRCHDKLLDADNIKRDILLEEPKSESAVGVA